MREEGSTNEAPGPETLRRFSPLDGLNPEHRREILRKAGIESVSKGRTLFEAGDRTADRFYVLSGGFELLRGDRVVKRIDAGSEEAGHALAHQIPRPVTARAAEDSRVLRVDPDLLDVLLTWDQSGAFEVGDLGSGREPVEGEDWMTHLLRTKAFHRVPPANIQRMFLRIEPVEVAARETVIRQGDPGDYFYVIASGRCTVSRRNPASGEDVVVARLGVGDSFGEEALVSGAERNATVTMTTDGRLMRLGRDDFQSLLQEPLLEWVEADEAQRLVESGACWLDVRMPREFQNGHPEGAVNIPLLVLRRKLDRLDPGRTYVVCCDTGRRSSAAAYLLSERDFDARVLRGGLTGSGFE